MTYFVSGVELVAGFLVAAEFLSSLACVTSLVDMAARQRHRFLASRPNRQRAHGGPRAFQVRGGVPIRAKAVGPSKPRLTKAFRFPSCLRRSTNAFASRGDSDYQDQLLSAMRYELVVIWKRRGENKRLKKTQ